MTEESRNNRLIKSLSVVVMWGAILFFFDALFFNQGIVSGIVFVWALFFALPKARTFTKDPEFRRYLVLRALIYLGAAVLVIAFNFVNVKIAGRRAEGLVNAVKSYNIKYGHYPESLNALVPEFIEEVPRPKYTLGVMTGNRWQYASDDKNNVHYLGYVKYPPFLRRVYRFDKNAWMDID